MKIRRAKKEDAKKILKLFSVEPFLSANPEDSLQECYNIDDILGYIKMRTIWVSVAGDEITGFIWLQIYPTYIYLEGIAVKYDHRGSGISQELLDFMYKLGAKKGIKDFCCETAVHNTLMQQIL
ncbi:GNAT family N-acetyltransferase, partial [Candidatus Parcubacteria bacterium]|nr:GNAT family N-acetyltransferase [Candidatus Parcubacteria bacterium]